MFRALFRRPEDAPGHAARLRRLERKLDLILLHLGIEYVEPDPLEDVPEQVRALADRGETIGAIKLHRDITGAGLAEAKRVVEAYLARKS